MSLYIKMKANEKMDYHYAKGFVDALLKENVPSIFLGDIPKQRQNLYFNIDNLKKEKYFKLLLGDDIVKSIANKYHHKNEKKDFLTEGNWTEGNGILFYCTKNMIIVLDYEADNENQCLLVEWG